MRPLGRVALEACIEYLAPRVLLLATVAAIVGLVIAPWWAPAAIVAVAWCARVLLGRKKIPRPFQSGINTSEVWVGSSMPESSSHKKNVGESTDSSQKKKTLGFRQADVREEKNLRGADVGVVAVKEKNAAQMLLLAWTRPVFGSGRWPGRALRLALAP